MDNERGENAAEKLMGALISKMEDMDSNIKFIKAENAELKIAVNNPASLLRKAGFVSTRARLPEDVLPDTFRGDSGDILKGPDGHDIEVPTTNVDFHEMNWDDIHVLADQAKSSGAIGNQLGME